MNVETLESRRMFALAEFLTLTNSKTLIVHGTDADDAIDISMKSKYQMQISCGPNGGPNPVFSFYQSANVKFTAFKRLLIEGGAGNDRIIVGGGELMTHAATLMGGDGNDQLFFNTDGPVLADGGNGNDRIGNLPRIEVSKAKNRDVLNSLVENSESGQQATLLGGTGIDTLAGDVNDHLDGGDGNDKALVSFDRDISQARRLALAHDYYARIGALNVESFET